MGEASRLGKRERSLTARYPVFNSGIVGLAFKWFAVLFRYCFFFLLLTLLAISSAASQTLFILLATRFHPPTMTRRDGGAACMYVGIDLLHQVKRRRHMDFLLLQTIPGKRRSRTYCYSFLLLIPWDMERWPVILVSLQASTEREAQNPLGQAPSSLNGWCLHSWLPGRNASIPLAGGRMDRCSLGQARAVCGMH
ncbi:hypothetical protein V8C26DRAFT_52459 [Trichoderma gracile]